MPTGQSPERIARARIVATEAVLDGGAELRDYPHRHLAVLAHRGATAERLTDVLAAVDVLTELGWELINVAEIGDGHSRMTSAVMRRRGKI